MKLSIPDKIRSAIDTIEQVYLETSNLNAGDNAPAFIASVVSKKHIEAVNFLELNNDIYNKAVSIQYRIIYKNKVTEIIKFANKKDLIFKIGQQTGANVCVRYKISNFYEDTDESRIKCFKDLDEKILEAYKLDSNPIGSKKLICYSVYFNNGYTDLLNLSVMSILKHSKLNFDLMIITDESTKKLIENLEFTKKIKPSYLITKTPIDGVEASQNKTLIFDYENINEYYKILFLDCDIVCVKDINKIFNLEYNPDYIYAAKPQTLDFAAHKGIWHGFPFLGDDFVNEMRSANQMPFNAGQFLVINSKRMRKHFENLNWFMEAWSGEYFFEQCFMCYYFGKSYSIGNNRLDNHVTLINTTNDMKYILNDDTHLIHFIAPPLQALKKIEFIKNYLKKNKPSFINKIKNFFYAILKRIQVIFNSYSQNGGYDY